MIPFNDLSEKQTKNKLLVIPLLSKGVLHSMAQWEESKKMFKLLRVVLIRRLPLPEIASHLENQHTLSLTRIQRTKINQENSTAFVRKSILKISRCFSAMVHASNGTTQCAWRLGKTKPKSWQTNLNLGSAISANLM